MLLGHLCWPWQVMLFSLSNLLGSIAFLAAFIVLKRCGIRFNMILSNSTGSSPDAQLASI